MGKKITVNAIIEKHLGQSISDEDVIHILVELRRKNKNNQLHGPARQLYEELKKNGMI